eukprot:Ihof_evm3s46 gene=Ihof_evmTU3s46
MANIFDNIEAVGSSKHPKDEKLSFSYGTAGFRTKGAILDSVMYRMGLLAALRSRSWGGKTIGAMITASHNPEEDNGVKLVDPMGEMLAMTWEGYATTLANTKNGELSIVLKDIIEKENIDMKITPKVIYGMDTRVSGPALCAALHDGLVVMETKLIDFGIITTPMLHYLVCCTNTNGAYGEPTIEGYYNKLSTAFKSLKTLTPNERPLVIDCANGVGAPKIKEFATYVGDYFPIRVINDGNGALNADCGADFVKVQQQVPLGCQVSHLDRCVSFDGDADRVVYFYVEEDGTFRLLDGDKIATLAGGYLGELITAIGLDINLGVVQTAYANGSSSSYLIDTMHVQTAFTPTGVKHVHHKAQSYDIGVYFEANGHGTVLFSAATEQRLRTLDREKLNATQITALNKLISLIDVINQTVGDALADCLMVEVILHQKGWTLQQWNACYTDLPSRQLKVLVKDRTVITTTDAERIAVTPVGLQDAINATVAKYPKGRSFV